jgi:cell division protein FtsB
MNEEMRKIWQSKRAQQLFDIRNIALYIFCIVAVAITWSSVKAVQANYQLQKKISGLEQQNNVLKLQNENTNLQNKYFQTSEYLDLSARENLGLAAPGEKVLIVPKSTAMKYVDQSLLTKQPSSNVVSADQRPRYIKNLESWRDFLLGRKQSD